MEKDTRSTILIVDDNKNNLDLMLVTLSDENFRLLAATSGERALKIAQKVEPDLVLMDIQMPGIDGYETARRMKSELKLKDMPILFLSALNDLTNIVQCFAAGGVDYISKPFKKEELLARVKTHLSIRQLQTEIRGERDRFYTVLKSILPLRLIEELAGGKPPVTEFIPHATVLFTDFARFTHLIKKKGATLGIEELNKLFAGFDQIIMHMGLERVKTIGDAYMAVAGVNDKPSHLELRTLVAAQLIQQFVKKYNLRSGGQDWNLRVGIHVGPVIAGIVGRQRIAYDVWGNTVNVSSRLENMSDPGSISISRHLYDYVSSYFEMTSKGVKELHNWGQMEIFDVESSKHDTFPDEIKALIQEFDFDQVMGSVTSGDANILQEIFKDVTPKHSF